MRVGTVAAQLRWVREKQVTGGKARPTLALCSAFLFLVLAACSRPEIDAARLADIGGVFYDRSTGLPFTGNVTGAIQGRLKDGRWQGQVTTFGADGSKQSEASFKNGLMHGFARSWHTNGQSASLAGYAKGDLEGEFTRWYDNGTPELEKSYANGQEEGLERRFLRNGRPLLERRWRAGRKHGVETYYCWPDASPGANFGACADTGSAGIEPVMRQDATDAMLRVWCYEDGVGLESAACAVYLETEAAH